MACPVSHDKMVLEKVDIPATMKAIRIYKCGKPEVLQLESGVPLPKFGKSQVLIRVLTIGVNPYETYQRSSSYGGEFPGILGSDCAGIVAQVGSQVKRVKVGDRVFTAKTVSGSYAEYTVAEEIYTFPLHENLTFSQGAALGVPYFTAYKALFMKAQCRPGETVLVHGASGGVGIACCQIARGHGLHVLGTAGTEYGMTKVQENGAHAVFNHREHDTYINKIREFVGKKGIDIICEMSASKNWINDLSLLSRKGRLIVNLLVSKNEWTASQSILPQRRSMPKWLQPSMQVLKLVGLNPSSERNSLWNLLLQRTAKLWNTRNRLEERSFSVFASEFMSPTQKF